MDKYLEKLMKKYISKEFENDLVYLEVLKLLNLITINVANIRERIPEQDKLYQVINFNRRALISYCYYDNEKKSFYNPEREIYSDLEYYIY